MQGHFREREQEKAGETQANCSSDTCYQRWGSKEGGDEESQNANNSSELQAGRGVPQPASCCWKPRSCWNDPAATAGGSLLWPLQKCSGRPGGTGSHLCCLKQEIRVVHPVAATIIVILNVSILEDWLGKPCQVTRDHLEPQRPRFVSEAEMFSLRTFLEGEASRNYWRFLPHGRPCAGGTSHQLCGMGWPGGLGLDVRATMNKRWMDECMRKKL